MWRTLHKLQKTLSDQQGPRRVADMMKNRIDKFKVHIPLLQVICNPGLKDRHWEQMSNLVGLVLPHDESASLNNLIELGLAKYVDKLDEIGGSASKEYSLEKAMTKMKDEWNEMLFTFVKYRDTSAYILSAVDDIQLLLDDHIIKAQTMLGSPFIKPLEDEMRAWCERLTVSCPLKTFICIRCVVATRYYRYLAESPSLLALPWTDLQFRWHRQSNARRRTKVR